MWFLITNIEQAAQYCEMYVPKIHNSSWICIATRKSIIHFVSKVLAIFHPWLKMEQAHLLANHNEAAYYVKIMHI